MESGNQLDGGEPGDKGQQVNINYYNSREVENSKEQKVGRVLTNTRRIFRKKHSEVSRGKEGKRKKALWGHQFVGVETKGTVPSTHGG